MLNFFSALVLAMHSFGVFATTTEISTIREFPFSLHSNSQIIDTGVDFVKLDSILEDPSTYQFVSLPNPTSNLGFTNHHYWVRFGLNNTSDSPRLFFLETGRPITDVADLYTIDGFGTIQVLKNGDLIPFEGRPVEHRKLLYPIRLEANSSADFYLHLHSDGEVINLPLVLHDEFSLIKTTYFDQLVFGIFYGLLGLASVTYLFFYFGIKERSYLLYSSYALSVALLHASLDGYFFQYFLKNPGWFADRSLLIFATLSAILFGRFTQVFIRVKNFSPLLNRLYHLTNSLLLVLLIGILVFDAGRLFYYPAVNALGFVLILLSIGGVILSFLRKQPVDVFFALGISSFTLGFIAFILNNFSLIPSSFITENSAKLGNGLEILFFSLSMANRIRILRAEKEKAQALALQRSEESNEIKSYFLSNVSHELRTPLNAILGLSKSIMEEIKDEKIKENLEVINYSSVSLLSSIDDILDYSKIEKGELNLESKPFDLHKVLQEVKNHSYQKSRDKGLIFSYEEKVPVPKRIVGDATRFRQILTNLIGNAVKFTPAGEVKLTITSMEDKGAQLLLGFRITDTGIGIKPAKLERIFESFIQEQIDDKRKFGGFGLGLCIVKALTELHRGSIDVESTVGKGTQIDLLLAFGKSQERAKDWKSLSSERILDGKKILVVEDNPVNQLVIKSILKKWKTVTYDFANDGLQGLTKLQDGDFDLILMDLQMPEMDGYEATEAIRAGKAGARYREIPIIAVTADTAEKSKERARLVGMDDYLTKPVDSEILREKVIQAFILDKVLLGQF